jgi:hypothetical protein
MKYLVWLSVVLFSLPLAAIEHVGIYQHGTVVRMRMGDCAFTHHSFMVTMAGPQAPVDEGTCPEYTLVSDKVVFVIIGRSSNQIVPLADIIDFRFHSNELAIRVDDARHESKFTIKEMILRSEWDMVQRHIENELSNAGPVTEGNLAMRTRE